MEALKVSASLDSLSSIGAFVLSAAEKAGLDKRAAYRLRLAVDEIATNVVVHGRPGERGYNPEIVLTTDMDDRSLTVTLEDQGPEFNPLEREDPDHIDNPMHERPIGGLGVFLAIRGVDQFRYERTGNANRNVFVVHRPVAQASGQ